MSYKPDESTLVAYLYNELNTKERSKVEEYFKAYPEKKKELDEITSMRQLLGKWEDKEVTAPSFVFDNSDVVVVSKSIWKTGFFRTTVGVAASIALLMVVGYFTNLSVTKNDTGVQLTFGKQVKATEEVMSSLTEADIKSIMQETLSKNNDSLFSKITEVENNISDDFVTYQKINNRTIQSINKNSIDESLIQEYVAQLKEENKSILFDLVTSTENVQKQYVNDLMVDFSLYLEEQRQSDLQMIQTSFNNLKDNTEVSQVETNQILASIITTVNNQNN